MTAECQQTIADVHADGSLKESPLIHVRIDTDPTRAELGFEVGGSYVEQFYASRVGPTGILLLRHLVRCELPTDPRDGYAAIDVQLTRLTIGVGRKGFAGKNGALFKSLDRLERFGLIRIERRENGFPTSIAIYSHVSALPVRHRKDWPELLHRRHTNFLEAAARTATAADPSPRRNHRTSSGDEQ